MSAAYLFDLLSSAIRGGVAPEVLFEVYIPGFKSLRSFFSSWLRLDLAKVLNIWFFCLIYMTAGQRFLHRIYEHVLGYFTSTISLQPSDPVNRDVLAWISGCISKRETRFLAAQSKDPGESSPYGSTYVSKSDKSALRKALGVAGRSDSKMNPIKYYPAIGKFYFLFESRPFIFDLLPGRYQNPYDFSTVPTGDEPILVRCLGRNPTPLKRFLEHCRNHAQQAKQSMTTIYTTGVEKYGSRLEWRESNVRPVRPMNTIDLADGIKEDIINDIERYLHPSTRLFYARRGIPYRRGFLLHGPPGTGKTSFSLALAGHFDLDLYMISLASHGLNDDGLAQLFHVLPQACIVLMEDIDSAGIGREDQSTASDDSRQSFHRDRNPISLSGLLNTIDGAASQEGRILIMTSNSPDTLDPALIRHGRIDKQIKFDYITKADTKALFVRLFSMHEDEQPSSDRMASKAQDASPVKWSDSTNQSQHVKEIESLAEEFSSKLLERKLAPAEVQGFLLDHRDDPKEAAARFSDWILDTLATRFEKREQLRKKRETPEKVETDVWSKTSGRLRRKST